ncbi:MAG TPA: hypothetical protein VJT15_24545 [Pyrinomonadaceae bacterium]|nr:hypothetical protein [Pyrinomonadaceae bacterium]
MNRKSMQLAVVCLLLLQSVVLAQSVDVPKYEVGVEFTTLERDQFGSKKAEAGVGARFTYNLNEMFAFEAAGYLFPDRCSGCLNGGRMHQIVGGVKVGKRFEKWGFFAKARPGVVSFSRGQAQVVGIPPGGPFPFELKVNRTTNFAVDIGGVVEFYPSRRIVTRFDVGDTMIHFKQSTTALVGFDPLTGTPAFFLVTRPARTTHNFQFIASVGFRF